MRWVSLSLFLLLILAPSLAQAEVMDKESIPYEIWAWALLGGAVAVLAWRIRAWLGAITTAGLALNFISLWGEITDPFVGPAIRSEAGNAYLLNARYATVAVTVLVLCGVIRAFLRPRRLGSRATSTTG
jgi:hypothetical protein